MSDSDRDRDRIFAARPPLRPLMEAIRLAGPYTPAEAETLFEAIYDTTNPQVYHPTVPLAIKLGCLVLMMAVLFLGTWPAAVLGDTFAAYLCGVIAGVFAFSIFYAVDHWCDS